MVKSISQESVWQALDQVMHPEVNYSLVKLGMIEDIVVRDNKVTLTLKVPFKEIPIKDMLIQNIKDAITKLEASIEVQLNIAEMTQEERAAFVALAREGWKF